MSHKTERQRPNRQRRKKEKRIANAIALSVEAKWSASSSHQDMVQLASVAPQLMQKLADTLNLMDVHGITVQLTDGAIITEYGYVFWFGRDEEAAWQVRTKRLTEFSPAISLGDDDTDS